MASNANHPTIIKRKKVSGGEGHHGGAWKVAYADFVTAMMAFFLLMWLLGATNEKQRKGIADYFNPTIPVNRVSGGGAGVFGGESVFTEETFAENGSGPSIEMDSQGDASGGLVGGSEAASSEGSGQDQDPEAETEELKRAFKARMEASSIIDLIETQVSLKSSDEGLVIEIFDLSSSPLFPDESAEPTGALEAILEQIAAFLQTVPNEIAVNAHSRTRPLVQRERDTWELTSERANIVRSLLETNTLTPSRVARLTGHSDRKPSTDNPLSLRNNRVEIILIR